jgi:hypothetical protein
MPIMAKHDELELEMVASELLSLRTRGAAEFGGAAVPGKRKTSPCSIARESAYSTSTEDSSLHDEHKRVRVDESPEELELDLPTKRVRRANTLYSSSAAIALRGKKAGSAAVHNAVAVEQYDLSTGRTVRRFSSQREAAMATGNTHKTVSRSCRGEMEGMDGTTGFRYCYGSESDADCKGYCMAAHAFVRNMLSYTCHVCLDSTGEQRPAPYRPAAFSPPSTAATDYGGRAAPVHRKSNTAAKVCCSLCYPLTV